MGTESVDFVCLDPQFNANRNYNVLFKDESRLEAGSRVWLSADKRRSKGSASTYDDLSLRDVKASEILQAFRSLISQNLMMAYFGIPASQCKLGHRLKTRLI